MSAASVKEKSLLEKLNSAVPGLARFDAFPKLPSAYKARSESRGFLTLFVILIAILLVLNDFAEYIWGWPDYEFSVDTRSRNIMKINVDMVVNTPCDCMYPPTSIAAHFHSYTIQTFLWTCVTRLAIASSSATRSVVMGCAMSVCLSALSHPPL